MESGGSGRFDPHGFGRSARRWALIAVLGLAALAWRPPGVSQAEEPVPYLKGPQGPYRGRVLDSTTDQPLQEAVILMFWQRAQIWDEHVWETFAFREALTDASGVFVIDALAIEGNLPPRALQPRLLIYKPGYTTFPRKDSRPPGVPAVDFTRQERDVRLGPLTDPEDRADAFNIFLSGLSGARGGGPDFTPLSDRILRQEWQHFGRSVPKRPPQEGTR